jgi:hypothetical protein
MTHLALRVWRGKSRTRQFAIYVGLIGLTGITAVLLVPFNIHTGLGLFFDAQSEPQSVAAWRLSAALAYTSGSEVGPVFALVTGLLIARWKAHRATRIGLLAAVSAGAGLGLVDMVPAWSRAASPLHDLVRNPALMSRDGMTIDSGLLGHSVVLVVMAVAFVHFLIAAGAGFLVVRRWGDRLEIWTPKSVFILVLGYAVFAFLFHFVLAVCLIPWPT